METPITDIVKAYMVENRGWINETDVINAIAALASMGDESHIQHGYCTETLAEADVICGSRSMVEHAMSKLHDYSKVVEDEN